MLKLLAEYAQKPEHNIETEPGFESKDIRWAVVLDSKKGFLGIQRLGDENGRHFKKCPDLSQMEMVSGKETKSQFLVDDAGVITGEKAERHNYFVRLLEEAGKASPQLAQIANWLRDSRTLEAINQELKAKKVKDSEDVTFVLDDEFLLDHDYWHDWWRQFRRPLVKKINKDMRCFVTGEMTKPMATHYKIKGLPEGRASGDALVGFDKTAFQSYGLEQSANAAVSEEAMSAYRAGLNELIKNHSRSLAGAKVAHWYKDKIPTEDLLEWLIEPPKLAELNAQHEAKKLLESIKTGERPDLASNYYYALTLSGAGGRVMVRGWMEGRFEELVVNVNRWFNDLEIVNLFGGRSANPPGLERVTTCLLPLRKPNQDYGNWIKPLGSERLTLLHAAIKGTPIPYSTIPRVAVEHRSFMLSVKMDDLLSDQSRDISVAILRSMLYVRMSLIKAYHIRKYRKEENTTVAENLKPMLNEDYPSSAYQCGRLMAVLAELQRRALGDVGAGVVQRYYAAASTTPALVLGRLTRTSQFHLNKLDPGLAYWYESKIACIWSRLNEAPPRTLSLEEQSLFALGYYQQMADMRTKKSEKSDKEEPNG